MDLSQAYDTVPKTSISTLGCVGRMPVIQRDSNIMKLEQDVFSQIASVLPSESIATVNTPSTNKIKFVSFEDAIKELAALEK